MSLIACPPADAREASAAKRRQQPGRAILRVAVLAAAGLMSASNAPVRPETRSGAFVPYRMIVAGDSARSRESDTGLIATGTAAFAANRQRAFDGRIEPVAPFRFAGGAADFKNAVDCLAAAAYYEAGDDPNGQAAVVQVVINRTRHPVYPSTLCAVVFEGSERETGCQFTFTCDGSLARKPAPAAWQRARKTAMAALAGRVDARVGTATHYHADYVLPYWAASLRKLTQIGAHIFYRWPGSLGSTTALRDPAGAREIKVAVLSDADQQGEAASSETDIQLPIIEVVADPAFSPPAPPQPVVNPGSTIMTVVDGSVPPGRWAIDAMDACGARDACLLLAYPDADSLQRNRGSGPAGREAPAFLLVRDPSSGVNMALWDCTKVQRPSTAQCLPGAGPALARLLRDRG